MLNKPHVPVSRAGKGSTNSEGTFSKHRLFCTVYLLSRSTCSGITFVPPVEQCTPRPSHAMFLDLMRNPAPHLSIIDVPNFDDAWMVRDGQGGVDHRKLKELLDHISSNCSTAHEHPYAVDLHKSFDVLRKDSSVKLQPPPELTSLLEVHLAKASHD